ncbi:MAG: thiamine pyrophosphate-dependent dehydrogenase E1 component subunit alpha [Nocardiopsaceae bacterium]|nr:thiamine pyrophosphate-dependent dehydrogenase E1 component subunit alpha [Nocardiopsaceae bacterium]
MDRDEALRLYESMVLIRRVEERLRDDSAAGKLPGAVHLYIGEEAVATGVCAHLTDRDYATSTHRGHGHFLAKGGDVRAMMAEIRGKREGICRGMGGSMHVADLSKGILGANGIVGAGLSIACGAAFGAQLDGSGRVAVCFFGDGAANQGALMETLNVSALWRLPLVFVCEHNGFAEFTPAAQVTAGRIADRARAFGIPAEEFDGNDVTEVWRAAGNAIRRAREGGGPSFLEARTYRIQGHFEAESFVLGGGSYRGAEEIEEWRSRDPIARFRTWILSSGPADKAALDRIEATVGDRVTEAIAYAEAGELADPGLAETLMFAPEPAPEPESVPGEV